MSVGTGLRILSKVGISSLSSSSSCEESLASSLSLGGMKFGGDGGLGSTVPSGRTLAARIAC
jgi:hypothetical protein